MIFLLQALPFFVIIYIVARMRLRAHAKHKEKNAMSEKWSVEQLFFDENAGNPFQRGAEEMRLWECVDGKEAYMVWRGYDPKILQDVIKTLQRVPSTRFTYCVEFPSRKGERDSVKQERRDKVTGAKCLPNARQRLLLTAVENRWGAALNEEEFMRSRGRTLAFYMRSDKSKETVFTLDTWDEVQQMAYAKRMRSAKTGF